MPLMEISRLRFKQYKSPRVKTQINVLGCFVNFFVIFRYIFLKRIVNLIEIINCYDLMQFKKLKIDRWTPKQSPTNQVCSQVGSNCLLVFQKQFPFFYLFFKFLKCLLNISVASRKYKASDIDRRLSCFNVYVFRFVFRTFLNVDMSNSIFRKKTLILKNLRIQFPGRKFQ